MPSNSLLSPPAGTFPARPSRRAAGGPEDRSLRQASPAPSWTRLLAGLRREQVARPVIFVGAGTCGLGAGADKTLARVKAYCAGLGRWTPTSAKWAASACAPKSPSMDVQLPGRTRVCFANVTEDKVDGLLDAHPQGRPAPGRRRWASSPPTAWTLAGRQAHGRAPLPGHPEALGAGQLRPDRLHLHRRVHRPGRLLRGAARPHHHDPPGSGGRDPGQRTAGPGRRRLPHRQEVADGPAPRPARRST